MQWQQGEVVECRHWNERLCSLKIDVAQPDFEAGQFVRVGLPAVSSEMGETGEMEARPYSFVNAPGEPLLEIYFNRVPEGSLSNRLFELNPGDEIYIGDRPAGFMVMSEVPPGQVLWMLATGTALGPFLSMLKTEAPWQQFEKLVLVHGVRSADELTYQEQIAQPAFEAGQFVRVGLPAVSSVMGETGEMEARPYSFVNAPGEPLLEIYFNRVPEGSLSNRLFELNPGDEIYIGDRPAGFMVMSEVPPGQVLWMLATGTALGPFLSMLKTEAPWQQFEKLVLVHGVRSADELTYQEQIQALQALHPEQLIKLDSVTREETEGALLQRIPDVIRNGQLEAEVGFGFDPQRSRVMLCGNPGMVHASLEALEEKGLRKHLRRKPGQILQEIYR